VCFGTDEISIASRTGMAGTPHRSSDPMAGTRAMEKRFFARLKSGQERATGR